MQVNIEEAVNEYEKESAKNLNNGTASPCQVMRDVAGYARPIIEDLSKVAYCKEIRGKIALAKEGTIKMASLKQELASNEPSKAEEVLVNEYDYFIDLIKGVAELSVEKLVPEQNNDPIGYLSGIQASMIKLEGLKLAFAEEFLGAGDKTLEKMGVEDQKKLYEAYFGPINKELGRLQTLRLKMALECSIKIEQEYKMPPDYSAEMDALKLRREMIEGQVKALESAVDPQNPLHIHITEGQINDEKLGQVLANVLKASPSDIADTEKAINATLKKKGNPNGLQVTEGPRRTLSWSKEIRVIKDTIGNNWGALVKIGVVGGALAGLFFAERGVRTLTNLSVGRDTKPEENRQDLMYTLASGLLVLDICNVQSIMKEYRNNRREATEGEPMPTTNKGVHVNHIGEILAKKSEEDKKFLNAFLHKYENKEKSVCRKECLETLKKLGISVTIGQNQGCAGGV